MKRTLWTVGFAIALLATTIPARADKCTGAKLKAVGTKEAGLLACQAKVAAKNDGRARAARRQPIRGINPARPS